MSKAQLEAKKAELIAVSEQIKSQNEAIEKLKIDVEKFRKQKEKVVYKVIEKYGDIPDSTSNTHCYVKLENIRNALAIFHKKTGINYKNLSKEGKNE